ncbi:MAG: ABC transporter ATP-binding protein [bacterium]|nr:ABC transporter ATP-binding protein [bacterium]
MLRYQAMTRRYGDLVAVEELSLEVQRGEMFGMIGPDGAGKTTSLRVALGLLAPHGGTVVTCGLNPHRQRRRLAGRVGYLSQRFSLYGDLSVDENIGFFAEIHGVRGWKARREELLELVRMTPFRRRLAERLSGGMKQKLALACTLIHRPQLLILDEPTTGVDPVSRRDFWKLLARLQRGGLTLVMTTPYLDEAERCQRVALLDHGRLLAMDDPQALRRRYQGVMVEVLATPRRRAVEVLSQSDGVTAVEIFGERVHATLPELGSSAGTTAADRLAAELRGAGVDVELARPVVPSLEDVFIARIRAAEADQEEVQRR